MKKILVPVDFSEESLNALKFAAGIAKQIGATIKLLNIIEAPTGDSFSPMADGFGGGTIEDVFVLKLREKNIQRIKDLAHQPEYVGIVTEYKVHIDVVWDKIAKTISEIDAAFVVMGTKGTSNIDDIFIGSNAEKVIRVAHVPVLTFRKGTEFTGLKNIVLPSSFKENYPKIVNFIIEFAEKMGSNLHLLRVNTPGNFKPTSESLKMIADFAERHNIKKYSTNIFSHYSEEEGIRDFCNEKGIDLISIMTHGRQGLSRVFTSSITEEIVNKSGTPVFSFNLSIESEGKKK